MENSGKGGGSARRELEGGRGQGADAVDCGCVFMSARTHPSLHGRVQTDASVTDARPLTLPCARLRSPGPRAWTLTRHRARFLRRSPPACVQTGATLNNAHPLASDHARMVRPSPHNARRNPRVHTTLLTGPLCGLAGASPSACTRSPRVRADARDRARLDVNARPCQVRASVSSVCKRPRPRTTRDPTMSHQAAHRPDLNHTKHRC